MLLEPWQIWCEEMSDLDDLSIFLMFQQNSMSVRNLPEFRNLILKHSRLYLFIFHKSCKGFQLYFSKIFIFSLINWDNKTWALALQNMHGQPLNFIHFIHVFYYYYLSSQGTGSCVSISLSLQCLQLLTVEYYSVRKQLPWPTCC